LPRKLQPVRTCTRCGSSTNEFYLASKVSDGKSSWCKPCFRDYRRERYVADPGLKAKRYSQISDWAKANPEAVLARVKRYQARHRQRVLESARASSKRRIAKLLAKNAKRRAAKLRATPSWANTFFIEEIYDLAQRRTKHLGEKHVVDHIIPLKHPLVCGLHVESNLRVVPQLVNAAKGNSFLPL